MVCTACGYTLGSDARFCSSCGRPLVFSSPLALRTERLSRPREGRMIAGVCAGFAQRYGWDVAIVRLIVVLSVILAGTPVLAYLVAWIVMPNQQFALPAQASMQPNAQTNTQTGAGPGSIAM